MKTLLIVRHGAAERASPSGDWGRTLTQDGLAAARSLGARISQQFGSPDVIVASDAARARQTADALAAETGFQGTVLLRHDLYEADPETLLQIVQALPDDAALTLLVGHNPGLEQLAWQLEARALAPHPLGTAHAVALQWETPQWATIQPQSGQRVSLIG